MRRDPRRTLPRRKFIRPKDAFRIKLWGGTPMTCREAECAQYENGWLTVVDPETEIGQQQAHYIRTKSGRRFIEFRSDEATTHLGARGLTIPPSMIVFKFWPGQQCFRQHADREVTFTQNKGERRWVHRPIDFNESFNEEAQKRTALEGAQ